MKPTLVSLLHMTALNQTSSTAPQLVCDYLPAVDAISSFLTLQAPVDQYPATVTCSGRLWTISLCSPPTSSSFCIGISVSAVGGRFDRGLSSSVSLAMEFSPCASECGLTKPIVSPAAASIYLVIVDFKQVQPAPAIMNSTVSSTENSITVRVALSFDGIVYCAAYPTAVVPSSVSSLLMDGTSASSKSAVSTVTIAGLQPLTQYATYCMTVSSGGVNMGYSDALNTMKTISTKCCKLMSV